MTDQQAIESLQQKFGVKVQILENGKWHLGNFVVDADIARKLAEKFTVK